MYSSVWKELFLLKKYDDDDDEDDDDDDDDDDDLRVKVACCAGRDWLLLL